jgi:WD40 repeat protein
VDTATGKLFHQMSVDEELEFLGLTFSPDGKRLAVGGFGTIRVWEVGTEKASWQFNGHRGQVTGLAFSPDGKRLASAGEDSTVLVWDVSGIQ